MTNTSEKRKLVSGNDHFKALVGKFREDLPYNWREKAQEKFPDLQGDEGLKALNNIFYGRSAADVEVILFLADLAGYESNGKESDEA